MGTVDVAKEIEDSNSEEEQDLEISDADEAGFDQYVPFSLNSGSGNGIAINISMESGQRLIK